MNHNSIMLLILAALVLLLAMWFHPSVPVPPILPFPPPNGNGNGPQPNGSGFPIQPLGILYGVDALSEDQIAYAAQFDILDTVKEVPEADLAAIKAVNPDITILLYLNTMGVSTDQPWWNDVDLHEDWFMHTTDGRRILRSGGGNGAPSWIWYCMDLGNSAFRAFWVDTAKSILYDHPSADGIFADDCWVAFPKADGGWHTWEDESGAPVDNSEIDQTLAEAWDQGLLDLLSAFKSARTNKLLIGNVNDQTMDAMPIVERCDGVMIEGFIHAPWWGLSEWHGYPADTWFDSQQQIEWLATVSGMGKYVLTNSGTEEDHRDFTVGDATRWQEMKELFIAAFLLGANGDYAYCGIERYYGDLIERGYYAEFAWDVGQPQGGFYAAGGLLVREFTKATVLVNVDICDSYSATIDGGVFTLPPHSSRIVWKE